MKRLGLFALLVVLACQSVPPPPATVDEATQNAIKGLTDAIAQQPTHTPWIYLLASYHDRAHDHASVVKWLERLDELGWEHGVSPIDFRNTNTRAFRDIVSRLEKREPRVDKARPAFTLAGYRDLVPEGIAYDPVDDVFYVSGIYRRKVLRVTRDGRARDFVSEGQDGMYGGLGVKVDTKRRLLWVISSTTEEMRGFTPGAEHASMLAAYDLRDGRLVKKVVATPGRLNDLTLLADGSLFATDMGRSNVVRLAPGADTLEIWASELQYPNGIAVSEDERTLYVADFRGIHRFDLATKARTRIESKSLLNGIDGLSVHNGSLIGIQNAIGKARVIRVRPESGQVEILESKNALFEIPTTGTVAGNDYYFIANPGLRSFNEDHTIWLDEKLEEPVMLKLSL
ncbi:MAG TPA: SMP-30/gluconolactonase/LRE family protein [Thermoanaerobaculia bacterium]|nr:SMP-30/gluconolactonase/LRE family protein [Thermoanaerobaculia bacterium]